LARTPAAFRTQLRKCWKDVFRVTGTSPETPAASQELKLSQREKRRQPKRTGPR
jgi:hypothetical protein